MAIANAVHSLLTAFDWVRYQPPVLNMWTEDPDRCLVEDVVTAIGQLTGGRVRWFGVHSAQDYFAIIRQGACLRHNSKYNR